MSTWFDRRRGETQGRIVPQVLTATEGTHVFVLGSEQGGEAAVLQANDYTEVHQTLDLTGIDLVGATMETLGVAMDQFEHPVGMGVDGFTLGLWPMDENYKGAANLVQPGVNLLGKGDIAIATESYSAVASRCRKFPVASVDAQLEGVNTPEILPVPGASNTYTLLWWLNFDADQYVSSDGVNPVIFKCVEAGQNGLEVGLLGETGVGPPHRWWIYVRHLNAAADQTVVFTGYPITTSAGWKMFAIVFDRALVGTARLKLYVDGVFSTNVATIPVNAVGHPAAGSPFYIGDPALTGLIDQVKFYGPAMTPVAVSDEYDACVDPQVVNPAAWKMSVRIDDVVYCERTIVASEGRRWRDFYAPVRHLNGNHKVAFRLQIEEV